jgi:uncharacterized protein
MASEGYHEPLEHLSGDVVDRHRAISSIMEELEAVDWYDQRVSATGDASLAAVLGHNRDEEKEHAAMTIEWLRRNDPVFDEHLRTYLFKVAPITEIEDLAERSAGSAPEESGEPGEAPSDGSLGIGSLRSLPQEDQR